MKEPITHIKISINNKFHQGECIVCGKEENLVTNLVIFPTGSFAHLNCYPVEIKIR